MLPSVAEVSSQSPAARTPFRVELRFPRRGDAAAFCRFVRESREVLQPWVYAPESEESFHTYLERFRTERNVGLLACRREDGAIVGAVNFNEIVYGAFQSAYLGYFGNAAYAGNGYMTEALELACAYAFGKLRLHRLEANIQPGNEPSRRLIQRVGFRQEGFSPSFLMIGGQWRDHERWALLQEEWTKRHREARRQSPPAP